MYMFLEDYRLMNEYECNIIQVFHSFYIMPQLKPLPMQFYWK